MKCINCSTEIEQDFEYCPNCGSSAKTEVVSLNPAADRVSTVLKDKLFLIICILMSVASLLPILNGSFQTIQILLTVFLWIAYGKSCKNQLESNHLRCVSGTVFALYVVNYVLGGIIIFTAVMLAFIFALVGSQPDFINELTAELNLIGQEYSGISQILISGFIWVMIAVLILIGIGYILINAFGIGKIHNLAKSVYKSIELCELNIKSANAAKNWLYVFGIITAITTVGSITDGDLLTGITNGCSSAVMIISAILIKKYLLNEKI